MRSMHILPFAALALMALAACSGEKETAPKLGDPEEARMRGRSDARGIIVAQWPDTARMLLAADSLMARGAMYDSLGRHDLREVHDSSFLHTLRAARPELARKIYLTK